METSGSDDDDVAAASILLSKLPPEIVDTLLGLSSVRVFERGRSIFQRGDPATSVFVVLEGWVKLSRTAENGTETIVGVFTKGESFGEAAALEGNKYPVAAEAVSGCRLVDIPAVHIIEMIEARPELWRAMLAATFKHLQELVGQVEQLKAKTGAQRVAQFLLSLCQCEAGSCAVALPYEKGVIAGRLGLKPESLSRAFTRLKECGVKIERNNAVIEEVRDLRAFVDMDRSEAWGHVQ